MNNHSHHHAVTGPNLELFGLGILLLAIISYWNAAARLKNWPMHRSILWTLGACCIAISTIGPLANAAHNDFSFHMLTHLLLGMLAPLFIALSAPMTFILRSLPVKWARRISYLLKSVPSRILINPVIASLLNIGGLWVLYTTDLFANMHEHPLLYVLIHVHVFIAGFLFTISIISIDPAPHPTSFIYRAIVLVSALASHSILAKYIYAHPPSGVSTTEAEVGGMLMYYGGDLIDGVLIFVFCYQWFRMTRPRFNDTIFKETRETIKARS
ncbi:cytochrome c oxidase assembly protein [Bacillus pinisoli]|uniref:cytochrome c oxidase assembly protein n=1 Tax=Bacillus pinisoli TaxID=2901866 RepID=UPI001FF3AB51|nr:cytochrome c oxidase assembly protein [Bacillus pinisoli]